MTKNILLMKSGDHSSATFPGRAAALFLTTILAFGLLTVPVSAKSSEEEEGEIEITLSQVQIKTAGITTRTLVAGKIEETIRTTGEVEVNSYASSILTPRIPSVVMERHIRLGETVTKGQPLVTLFSVEMAKAQGRFVNVSQEWKRVRKLGKDIVSSKRYIQAKTDYQEIMAQLKAFGMTGPDIRALYKTGDLNKPGEYQLYAPQTGTVTADDFLIGGMVEPGTQLFELVDEKTVWIESPVPESQFDRAIEASRAIIRGGSYQGIARILMAHEKLDPSTRRRKIRLVAGNEAHKLHPGQFVNVEFLVPGDATGVTVPKEAVLRSPDGDWMLFIRDEDGGFLPREVEILQTVGDQYAVSGVEAGETIVITGSFFIQSELAKSGFSIHNH